MKRFRFGEEIDRQMDMAGMLMLLSCGPEGRNNKEDCRSLIPTPRVFQCKTCSRQFQSFQALGGHRASHRKPGADGVCNISNVQAKPRVHECSICGLEFAIGQALGGHMRKHRAHDAQRSGGAGGGQKKRVWLDLNFPPMESYEMKNTLIVDCFH